MGRGRAQPQRRARRPRTLNRPHQGQRAGGKNKKASKRKARQRRAFSMRRRPPQHYRLKRLKQAKAKAAASLKLNRKFKAVAVGLFGAKPKQQANLKAFQQAAKRLQKATNRAEQIIKTREREAQKQRSLSTAESLTKGRYDGELARDESGVIIGVYRRSGYQVTFHAIKYDL